MVKDEAAGCLVGWLRMLELGRVDIGCGCLRLVFRLVHTGD